LLNLLKTHKCFLLCLLILAFINVSSLRVVKAYENKYFYITNMAIPAVLGSVKAYYEGNSIKRAFFQGLIGGLIMQEGLKGIANAENHSSATAWKNKILFNYGASLAESAGESRITYKMDFGPFWLTHQENNRIKVQIGLNSAVVVASHLASKSSFDLENSLKYGTFAFKRNCNRDGTLLGSSALAYSNANIITTNFDGEHAGHELTHTFQYRRDMMSPLKVSNLIPKFKEKIGDAWFDDTAWTINWGLQCGWAELRDKDKSFDIPLEREAYWLERKYKTQY
jgi:hypothetical protein